MNQLATLGERIDFIKERIGSSVLAAAAGVSNSQISRYISNKSQPTIGPVVQMAEAAGVNLLWLATGKGPVFVDEPDNGSIPGYVSVEVLSLEESNELPATLFSLEWLKRNGIDHTVCRSVIVEDDAMSPNIHRGDDTLISLDKRQGDGIYAIKVQSNIVVRRLQFAPNGSIKIISDNPAYNDYTLTTEEQQQIEIIGRQVWHGGF